MKTHEVLQTYFERKRKTSVRFSLRALASRVEVSASFLSRVLSGKKRVPEELLQKLAHALDIEPEILETLAPANKPVDQLRSSNEVVDWALATPKANQILRNWYYIPMMELTTLDNFDGTAEMISERMQLSIETVEVALRELISIGLIKYENERYVKVDSKLRITSAKSAPLIRRFHDEMLERAQVALRSQTQEDEFQKRLITGITISADPEKIQKAKARLAEFLHELANDLIADEGKEVYHLSAQLFPLTKK